MSLEEFWEEWAEEHKDMTEEEFIAEYLASREGKPKAGFYGW